MKQIRSYRFRPPRFFGGSSSSSSENGMISSRNSNKPFRCSSCRYSASLKSSNCFSNFFVMAASNFENAFLEDTSFRGRRCTTKRVKCYAPRETTVVEAEWKHTTRRLCINNLSVRILSSSTVSGMYSFPKS